jgi:hypothetical protein
MNHYSKPNDKKQREKTKKENKTLFFKEILKILRGFEKKQTMC